MKWRKPEPPKIDWSVLKIRPKTQAACSVCQQNKANREAKVFGFRLCPHHGVK